MPPPGQQTALFVADAATHDGGHAINARCVLRAEGDLRVVFVAGMPIAHFASGDRVGQAYAMVTLVEHGWASQVETARAFGCSERTVRRIQERFEQSGLGGLGRRAGYPKGRARLTSARMRLVHQLKAKGESNRSIAQRLGVRENAVRKLLRRLGWKAPAAEQAELPLSSAHPNLSASSTAPQAAAAATAANAAETTVNEDAAAAPPAARSAHPNLSDPAPPTATAASQQAAMSSALAGEPAPPGADPNLSASAIETTPQAVPPSFDDDAANRQFDRLLACMGLLDDAAPKFRSGCAVPGAGVLLAIPALVDSGAIDIARDIYGSIGPAFYGLRTTIVTLLLMALMRIKRAEGLKEHSPAELGRLLGLDRAPEVKTLRRKLARLAACGRAAELGRALAERRVATRGHAMGFLYVDGHVRVYHGKREIPKAHVARMRLALPATTDYWVNDAEGEPLFVITAEANRGLVQMLPTVLDQVRALVGERRVTVIFDRGGYSPKLFKQLIETGFDILTYRKGRSRRVPRRSFSLHQAIFDGDKVSYQLADQNVLLLGRKLRLRQVTRLSDNGHQTPILTSRRDLAAVEVAYRMFGRWRQENFFKYLREEYALDALVDYATEPADPKRTVPNPKRAELTAELRHAYAELNHMVAEYGVAALQNEESVRRSMRGFKIANAQASKLILERMKRIIDIEKRRAKMPTRVPVEKVVVGEVLKLAFERKHLTDLLKMVAYQAESDLLRLLAPHYKRAEDEGRSLVQSAIATAGDIEVTDAEICVALAPLSSPHRTAALAALCEQLNANRISFPGTNLRLRFRLLPQPEISLAFPGARPPNPAPDDPQPDISATG
jgi:DNA-binding CsgD family transcriptional regulator